jgi:glycosyltransferase involved in cell wall biosynthesis
MKIVINDYFGHAAAVQLSRALAARGHAVLHLYSGAAQMPKADLTRRADDPAGFDIRAIGRREGEQRGKDARLAIRRYGRELAATALAFAPDVVLAGNNPLFAQQKLQSACRGADIRFVYWLKTLFSFEAEAELAGRSALSQFAAESYVKWLEGRLLQLSDAIVPIAEYELTLLEDAWGISSRQAMVVRDWAPLDIVSPLPKANGWSRQQGVAEQKIVLYSGTLDRQDEPELVLKMATHLRDREDVLVLVVSGGAGADRVRMEADARALGNLRVLPFQPYEAYPEVLASADVLFAAATDNAGVFSVPTKITSYLCAARPIVLCAGRSNLAADVIHQSRGGLVVDPGDDPAMRSAIIRLIDDQREREAMGARGRAYAERAFAIGPIADRFERLFERLRSGPPRSVRRSWWMRAKKTGQSSKKRETLSVLARVG